MNPPGRDDDEQDAYRGSEPLDPALADRFAYVVDMPGWEHLSEADRIAVITAREFPVPADAAAALLRDVARAHGLLGVVTETIGGGVADYVRILVDLLRQAGINLSPRRAGILYRSVLATHAAALALGPDTVPSDSALLAVTTGLPQRAQGIAVPHVKLLSAHREAWRLAKIEPGDPLRAILIATDPVERLRLAVAASTLNRADFSGIVADVLANFLPEPVKPPSSTCSKRALSAGSMPPSPSRPALSTKAWRCRPYSPSRCTPAIAAFRPGNGSRIYFPGSTPAIPATTCRPTPWLRSSPDNKSSPLKQQ